VRKGPKGRHDNKGVSLSKKSLAKRVRKILASETITLAAARKGRHMLGNGEDMKSKALEGKNSITNREGGWDYDIIF